jgi:predicted nucleic acid-binding protein
VTEPAQWVMDTSAYTHLCRAGHACIIEKLAPSGVVLIPREVDVEIKEGRERHSGIPAVSATCWAKIAVLTDDEQWTALRVKAALGGGMTQHLGESAVIACAHHRDLIAVLDDRAAIERADLLRARSIDTMWIVMEAYKSLYGRDKDRVIAVVDDLLETGMYLPFDSGEELFAWAYSAGVLP